jgi:hypothetical protein
MEDQDTICGFIAGCVGIVKGPPAPALGDADVASYAISPATGITFNSFANFASCKN